MATVKAFCGLRFADGDIKNLVTPPYDIISPAEQEALYKKDAHNIIRLEYGKDEPGDTENENKYTRAGAYLKDFMEKGVLKTDKAPSFYVYEETFSLPSGEKKAIKGIIARVKLQEFSEGVILPHEETLSKAKEDRFQLMEHTFANFSQIYSLYMDEKKEIPNLLESAPKTEIADFVDEDGIRQRMWQISDAESIQKIERAFSEKQLFIADGHHRYETGLRFKKAHPDLESAQYIMMFLIDLENDGLVVFPTHRVVTNLTFDAEKLLKSLTEFDVSVCEKGKGDIQNKSMPSFVMVLPDKDVVLTLKSYDYIKKAIPSGSDAYRTLDVNVLHKLILEKLGIDSLNMAQQKNLIYTRSEREAREMVYEKKAAVSFLMNATRVEQIKDVSLAGEKMPQKSTYFYPKLKTGLVMNKF